MTTAPTRASTFGFWRHRLAAVVLLALALPVLVLGVGGYAFVVDGVLMGADDGPWLARAALVTYAAYLPLILGVHAMAPAGQPERALVALWVAFSGFMVIRALLLRHRVRSDAWLVTGT